MNSSSCQLIRLALVLKCRLALVSNGRDLAALCPSAKTCNETYVNGTSQIIKGTQCKTHYYTGFVVIPCCHLFIHFWWCLVPGRNINQNNNINNSFSLFIHEQYLNLFSNCCLGLILSCILICDTYVCLGKNIWPTCIPFSYFESLTMTYTTCYFFYYYLFHF